LLNHFSSSIILLIALAAVVRARVDVSDIANASTSCTSRSVSSLILRVWSSVMDCPLLLVLVCGAVGRVGNCFVNDGARDQPYD
jgi:hypothetical protein